MAAFRSVLGGGRRSGALPPGDPPTRRGRVPAPEEDDVEALGPVSEEGEDMGGPASEELDGGASPEAIEAAGDMLEAFDAGDKAGLVRALCRILDKEGYGAPASPGGEGEGEGESPLGEW